VQTTFCDVTFTYADTVVVNEADSVLVNGNAVRTTGSGALTVAPRRIQYKQYKLQTPRAAPCVPNTCLLKMEYIRDDDNRRVYSRQGHSMDPRRCQAANILSCWQAEEYIWPQVTDVDMTGLSAVPAPDLAVAKYAGDETVDGASLNHLLVERSFTGDGAVGTPAAATITTDIYINRETALPAKIVQRASRGNTRTHISRFGFAQFHITVSASRSKPGKLGGCSDKSQFQRELFEILSSWLTHQESSIKE